MKEAIDIYGKFLIAIFSFIAPSMTLLIGLFGSGMSKFKKIRQEFVNQAEQLVLIPLKEIPDLDNKEKIKVIEKNICDLNKKKKSARKDTKLLSPKRQVLRIFIPLLTSTFSLIGYHINNENCRKIWEFKVSEIMILLSIFSLSLALFIIWQVFCKIIEVKEFLEQEKKDSDDNNVDYDEEFPIIL